MDKIYTVELTVLLFKTVIPKVDDLFYSFPPKPMVLIFQIIQNVQLKPKLAAFLSLALKATGRVRLHSEENMALNVGTKYILG